MSFTFIQKISLQDAQLKQMNFQQNIRNFKREVEIIGISPDDVESHKKFCNKMGIKYVLLSDSRKVSKLFGVLGYEKIHGTRIHGSY